MSRASRLVLAAAGALVVFDATAIAPHAASPPADAMALPLRAADGSATALAGVVHTHALTVVIFYADGCPVFAAHRDRLRALAGELGPRGVAFVAVDSERRAGAGNKPAPATAVTGIPLLRDEGGRLAAALDARFATESFVFDRGGTLRYRGGIDGDRTHLSDAPRAYLRDALTQLLAGRAPPEAQTKALGCVLRLE